MYNKSHIWKCVDVVTVLLVSPGWPPDVSVCWAHGLLFVVGAMCSHVDCLPPPVLLTNHCFSGSTCVSLVTLVCLPILASWCLQSCADPLSLVCVMLNCKTVLCLSSSFFPLRGCFCSFLFNFMIKTPFSCTWVLASSLSSRSHDRCILCWHGFLKYLLYKSSEITHTVFPDEQTHSICRGRVCGPSAWGGDALHTCKW